MGCCVGKEDAEAQVHRARREDLQAAARCGENGCPRLILSAPAIRCGHCIATIESALARLPEVASARVNLTLRRISVTLAAPDADPVPVAETLEALGYPATAIEPGAPVAETSDAADLVRALAVAGFGASNIMLMSVAVWSGAGEALREVFHLLSAAIALPVVAYAGRPFFASAWAGLRAGRLGMDVPISLGVLLTLGLSLFELAQGGRHVFFDAAVTLVFFLLVGRYFDALMRERARSAVTGLARLSARGGTIVERGGTTRYLPLDDIRPGMTIRILPGDRVPVDLRILSGGTDLDRSIVTGESAPVAAGPGDTLEAGSLNLTGAVDAEVLRPAGESFLAEVTRMLEAAEHGRGRYERVADRAARLYAPMVHTLAAAAFAGWILATGDLHAAIFVAVSVLIITCPCALGLAVPVVHVVASGRLFQAGIMIRDGSALERLATIDRAVFDKTGTLTIGTPHVTVDAIAPRDRAAVGALARQSAHPVSRALAAVLPDAPADLADARERPGCGVEARVEGRRARLGRAAWVAEIVSGSAACLRHRLRLRRGARRPDHPRRDAASRRPRDRCEPAPGGHCGRGRLRRCRRGGRRDRPTGWHRPVDRGVQPGWQGPPHRGAGGAGRACSHGRRRPERCGGACRRACLHGARLGLRCRTHGRRYRVHPGPPRRSDLGASDRPARRRPRAPEPCAGRSLQLHRRADRGGRLRHAAPSRGGDVRVLDPCGRKRVETEGPRCGMASRPAVRPGEEAGRIRMSALVILVPTSLVLGLIGLCCFIWSLRTKQYEDLDGAAERLLLDDPLELPAARQEKT